MNIGDQAPSIQVSPRFPRLAALSGQKAATRGEREGWGEMTIVLARSQLLWLGVKFDDTEPKGLEPRPLSFVGSRAAHGGGAGSTVRLNRHGQCIHGTRKTINFEAAVGSRRTLAMG